MATERVSPFNDDFDVSGFAPKKPDEKPSAKPDQVREVAAATPFRSREPKPDASAESKSATPLLAPRGQRRHTTGRNVQINIKATADAIARFHTIVDGKVDGRRWIQGEAFERAVAALERELAGGK
jgi:hypothetical protein